MTGGDDYHKLYIDDQSEPGYTGVLREEFNEIRMERASYDRARNRLSDAINLQTDKVHKMQQNGDESVNGIFLMGLDHELAVLNRLKSEKDVLDEKLRDKHDELDTLRKELREFIDEVDGWFCE